MKRKSYNKVEVLYDPPRWCLSYNGRDYPLTDEQIKIIYNTKDFDIKAKKFIEKHFGGKNEP